MPSSVKLKLFYDTKEIVSTVNKVLEPSPSPLKEHINTGTSYKKITQSQRNGNHNPSEFHQPEIGRRTNGEEFWVCVLWQKSQQLSLHLDTSCLNQLCSQPLTWLSNTWPKGYTMGSFLRNLHTKILQHCRAHSVTQADEAYTPLSFSYPPFRANGDLF